MQFPLIPQSQLPASPPVPTPPRSMLRWISAGQPFSAVNSGDSLVASNLGATDFISTPNFTVVLDDFNEMQAHYLGTPSLKVSVFARLQVDFVTAFAATGLVQAYMSLNIGSIAIPMVTGEVIAGASTTMTSTVTNVGIATLVTNDLIFPNFGWKLSSGIDPGALDIITSLYLTIDAAD